MISEEEVAAGLTRIRDAHRATGIRIRLFSKSRPRSRLLHFQQSRSGDSSFSKPAWADGSMRPMPRSRSSPSSRRSIYDHQKWLGTKSDGNRRRERPASSNRTFPSSPHRNCRKQRPSFARAPPNAPRRLNSLGRRSTAAIALDGEHQKQNAALAIAALRAAKFAIDEDRHRARAGYGQSGRRVFSAGTNARLLMALTIPQAHASLPKHGKVFSAKSARV